MCDVIGIFEDDILNYDRQVESKLNGQIVSGNCVTIGSSRKNDFYLRTNSREYYDYGNKFYDHIFKKYYNSKYNFYFLKSL